MSTHCLFKQVGRVAIALIPLLLVMPHPIHATPDGSLADAWQRAQRAGAYHFDADVRQTITPQASLANVGRESKVSTLHLEGETRLPDRFLHLTLWSQGGSVLATETGVEMRVEGDRAFARQGGRDWQEVSNFTSIFAPQGDFMAYLTAAQDVVRHAPETRAGLVFTRFTFRIDGRGYATYLRDQMTDYLTGAGELPPGVALDLPKEYVEMTGEGELWVDADGLPLRQELHLAFPPQVDDQEVAADITVDFSQFANREEVQAIGEQGREDRGLGLPSRLRLPSRLSLSPDLPLRLLIGAATIGFCVILIATGRSRRLYTILVPAVILSMVATPVVQSVRAAEFGERQATRQAEESTRAEESEMQSDLEEIFSESEHDPNVSPLAAKAAEKAAREQVAMMGSPPANGLSSSSQGEESGPDCDADDKGDNDGDGLTNGAECVLGTNPDVEDSDQDNVGDHEEVTGFEYNGKWWYGDPLEIDTNRDGLDDSREWNTGRGEGQDPPDTDGDGTPDPFDPDNDGDDVPDDLDLSPYFVGDTTYSPDAPFHLVLDNLTQGRPTFVEFQLRPTDPDHLWYALNVLDWPDDDRQGQVQDGDGKTFYDLDDSVARSPNDNGDVKMIPMLEIRISGTPDDLPPSQACDRDGESATCYPDLDNYGISVLPLNTEGSEKVIYLPLYLATVEKGDRRVAFAGKMLYRPDTSWGKAHQVRLVWMVQALTDVCEEFKDGQCVSYEETNQVQVIQTYGDEWTLTGLNVREEHGTEVAFAYEDPAVDTDLQDDSTLMYLMYGLEKTFLAGADCDEYDTESEICVDGDGVRDLTLTDVYTRFDHTINTTVPVSPTRWNIQENTLTVYTQTYTTLDEAVMSIAMTESVGILDDHFTAAWSVADPISPTLLYLREERSRGLNLDEQKGDSAAHISWSDDGQYLTLDLDPGKFEVATTAGANWAPYKYEDGEWKAYPIEDYWAELESRYAQAFHDEYHDERDPDEVRGGAVVLGQLYYLAVYKGITSIVQVGSEVMPDVNFQTSDRPLGATISLGSLRAVVLIVNKVVMDNFYQSANVLRGLNALMKQQRFYQSHTILRTVARAIKNQVRNWWSTARGIKTLGAVTCAVLLLLIAVIVLTVYLVKSYLNDKPWAKITLTVIVGVLLFAATVLLPLFQVINLVRTFAVIYAGMSIWKVVGKTLGASSKLIGMSKAVAVVMMVITIGVVWGVFIYAVVTEGIKPGSVAFSMLLAQTIAATILAVLLFALALTIVGTILVAIISLIDIILLVLGVDWSISGFLTEMISKVFFSFELALDSDVDMGPLDMDLVAPERGMVDGAEVALSTVLTTTVTHRNPRDPRTMLYLRYFDTDQLEEASFTYRLGRHEQSLDIGRGDNRTAWQGIEADHEFLGHTMYTGWKTDEISADTTLEVGINRTRTVDLYLNVGFSMPGVECWMIPAPPFWIYSPIVICLQKSVEGSVSEDFGIPLVMDVFPETLDEFMDVGAWADGLIIRDADGDGLLSLTYGGNDPDDTTWDTDGDGLSDRWELEMRGLTADEGGQLFDPLKADTDEDGLPDGEEVRLGTNPNHDDTDGDGISDASEVIDGWSFTYWEDDNGQRFSLQVYSDPKDSDFDVDGMDDLFERSLHTCPDCDPLENRYYPYVWNNNPIGLFTYVGEEDAVVQPGQSFVLTTTVRNSIKPDLWIRGDTSLTHDPFTGGPFDMIFDLPRDAEQSLYSGLDAPGSAATQDVDLTTELLAELHTPSVWAWDSLQQSIRTTTSGGTPQSVVVTPVDGWNSPYAAAVLEGDRVYVYQATAESTTGNGVHAIGWAGDHSNGAPDLACNDAGACLVTWASHYTTNDDDYFRWRRLVPSLQPDGAVRTLTAPAGESTAGGHIASDGSGFLAVWQEGITGDWTVYAQRIGADGAAHGGKIALDTGTVSDADVTWAYDRYLVAWAREGDLYLAEVPDGDVTQGAVASTAAAEAQPRLAYDPLGRRTLILYAATTGGTRALEGRIYVAGPSGGPRPSGEAFRIAYFENAVDPVDYDVSVDPINGGWVAAWGQVGGDSVAYRGLRMDGSLRGDLQTASPGGITGRLALTCAAPRPAASWPFDEEPGAAVFTDTTGFGNEATCTGGACPTAGSGGKFGNAITLDGTDDVLDVMMDVSESAYGVTLWFKTTCQDCGLFSARDPDGPNSFERQDRELYLKDGNVCARLGGNSTLLNLSSGGGTIRIDKSEIKCSSGTNYADGNWHQVAHTFGGSTGGQRLYVDGALQVSGERETSALTGQDRLAIGYAYSGGSDYLGGSIDDVVVYGRALSAGEVADSYRAALVIYPFDEVAGATIFNNAAHNGYTGSCVGSRCPTTGGTGRAYAAADFDGSNDRVDVANQPRTVAEYIYDFESAVGSEWSDAGRDTTPSGRAFLGRLGNEEIVLTLDSLPTHDQVQIDFDLYVIDSWDGNRTTSGPDYWEWSIDGARQLRTTFVNGTGAYSYQFYPDEPWTPSGVRAYQYSGCSGDSTLFKSDDPDFANDNIGRDRMSCFRIWSDTAVVFYSMQNYSGSTEHGCDGKRYVNDGTDCDSFKGDDDRSVRVWAAANAGFTGSEERNTLGYDPDAVYHFSESLEHIADILTVGFEGSGLESLDNESWGLDNVQVRVNNRNVPLSNASFTVAFWAKRDGSGTFDYAMGQGNNSAGEALFMGFDDANRFACGFGSDDLRTSGSYTDNDWHHWACTYDAGTRLRTIYRDGQQVAQDTTGANYRGYGLLRIGDVPWGGRAFDGRLDEFAVWNQALPQPDIETLYDKVKVLDDSVTECTLPRVVQGSSNLFTHRLALRETTTTLGKSEQERIDTVTIDADPPTSAITSLTDGQYIHAAGTLVIGGEATDNTSVAGIEVSVDGGAWNDAAGTEAWSYAWDTGGLGEGAYTLRSRATDAGDNLESAPASITVVVDRTPPTIGIEPLPLRADQDLDGEWVVRIDGSVSDPNAGGYSGSGVSGVSVLLEAHDASESGGDTQAAAGGGWQRAILYNNHTQWYLYYPLSHFTNDQQSAPNPTGVYTVSVQAYDPVDNRTPEPGEQAILRLDNTAPIASLDDTGPFTHVIASTLVLSGIITDVGAYGSGASGLQIGFRPAGQVDVNEGAVLHMRMDDLTSIGGVGRRVFVDSSGYNHSARCDDYDSCPTIISGKLDGALSFDGNDTNPDILTIAESENLNLGDGDGQFTLAMWIRAGHASAGNNKYGVFGHEYADGSRTPWLQLYQTSTGASTCVIRTGFTDENGDPWVLQSGSDMPLSSWAHVAVTYDGEDLVLYRNGTRSSSLHVGTRPMDLPLQFEVGQRLVDSADPGYIVSHPFDGSLDELTLYKRALSANEARALYESVSLGWHNATLDTTGGVTATWTYTLPNTLEGFYEIEVRGQDVAGNRNNEPHVWNVWAGEIDTQDPRNTSSLSNNNLWFGPNDYHCDFTDMNLNEASMEGCPCPKNTWQHTTYDEVSWWYRDVTTDTTRLYRIEADCRRNGPAPFVYRTEVCDVYGHCTENTINPWPFPGSVSGPALLATTADGDDDVPLYSTVITPANGIYTFTASFPVEGLAQADGYLRTLTVTADSTLFYTQNWPSDVVTDTTWSTTSPVLTEGAHVFESSLSDWAGRVQTTTHPTTITVDLLPPQAPVFDTAVITTVRRIGEGVALLTGTTTDTIGLQDVQVNPDGRGWGAASLVGGDWRFEWPIGEDPDGVTYSVTARANDYAGHTAETSQALIFDMAAPAPVTLTLGYRDAFNTYHTVLPGETVRDGARLVLGWTTGSDGSGLTGYRVGWNTSPTSTVGLSFIPSDTTTSYNQLITIEAGVFYAHLVSEDVHGNRRHQVAGPIYVDTPLTPDLIQAHPAPQTASVYRGWMDSGCSQLGLDRRVARFAPDNASLDEAQQFFATWNTDTLRLAWEGANWNVEGDLFVYLDVDPTGGATQFYNPYSALISDTIFFPGNQPVTDTTSWPAFEMARYDQVAALFADLAMRPDYMVWVESSESAVLFSWDGNAWISEQILTGDAFAMTGRVTDLYLPFDLLNISDPALTSLTLLAAASEEDDLRLWSAFPEFNILNGVQAVGSLAGTAMGFSFALTHVYYWPSLGSGICPATAGWAGTPGETFEDVDLDVSITAEPSGTAYTLLGDALAWQWETLFTEQGLKSRQFTFLDHNQPPVGDGDRITYTLHVSNRGTAVANDVQALVSSHYALNLTHGTRDDEEYRDYQLVDIGAIEPGSTVTATFTAEVVVADSWRYDLCLSEEPQADLCLPLQTLAAIDGLLFDSRASLTPTLAAPTSPPAEWFWVDHVVDTEPPDSVGIDAPEVTVRPGPTTVRGYASDPSGITQVEIEVTPGGGTTTMLTCPVSAPHDGRWTCAWTPSGTDGDVFGLRARATDGYGHVGDWSSPARNVVLDTLPPTVTLDTEARAAIDGQIIGVDGERLTGSFAENHSDGHVEVCRENGSGQCDAANLLLATEALSTSVTFFDDEPATPMAIDSSTSCSGDQIVRTFDVAEAFLVGDVNLGVNADHAAREELVVTLVSPSGTQARVVGIEGATYGFDNYDVWLDDAATAVLHLPIDDDTAAPYFDREAQPDAALSAFNGESAAGTWTLRICDLNPFSGEGTYYRARLALTPQGTAISTSGTWSYGLPLVDGADGLTQELAIYGVDGVGNRTLTPITVAYTLDVVSPMITVTATSPRSPLSPTSVLTGTVSDGGGLADFSVRVDPPDGASYRDGVVLENPGPAGGTWHFELRPTTVGTYTLRLEAEDHAANTSQVEPYTVLVVDAPRLTKAVTPTANVSLAGTVVYTLTVENPNADPVSGVLVTDRLPDGVTPLPNSNITLPQSDTVQWGPLDLTGGATSQITFTAMVTDSFAFNGSVITNTAHVTSNGFGEGDSNAASFQVEHIEVVSTLAFTKSVESLTTSIFPGDVLTYVIEVANDDRTAVQGVTITDTLPSELSGADLAWTGSISAAEVLTFTVAVTVSSDVAVAGSTITNSAYLTRSGVLQTAAVSFTVGIVWTGAQNSDWFDGANWAGGSVPAITDDILISPAFLTGAAVWPEIDGAPAVHSLRIDPDGLLTLLDGAQLTVTGALDNFGALRQQRLSVPEGITTTFGAIEDGNSAPRYYGVTLTPQSGDLLSTTVTIRGRQACASFSDWSALRCFDITVTDPVTATVRFYYQQSELGTVSAGTITVWHYGGDPPTWTKVGTVTGRGTTAPDYHWIEVSGIDDYSPFALRGDGATAFTVWGPTARGTQILISLLLVSAIVTTVAVRSTRRRRVDTRVTTKRGGAGG